MALVVHAPPLPNPYIHRAVITGEIKEWLLSQAAEPCPVRVLHGPMGIGKTTLMAHLVNQETILNRFPDGVLWIRSSGEPLVSLQWCIRSLGDKDYRTISLEAASVHLSHLLVDKTLLIIIDGAERAEHVRHLLMAGPRCKTIVTTNIAELASELDAPPMSVDQLDSDEAEFLVSLLLGRALETEEIMPIRKAIKSLGYNPLAIALATFPLHSGPKSDEAYWTQFRENLEETTTGKVLPEGVSRGHNNLDAVGQLVFQSPDTKKEGQRLLELTILARGAMITSEVAATVWNLDETEALDLLTDFCRMGMLQRGMVTGEAPAFVLPLFLWSLFNSFLEDGLQLNQDFLFRSRNPKDPDAWWTIRDNGYLPHHLVWHLEKAGLEASLHQLLMAEERERPAWYDYCLEIDREPGFLGDVHRALDLANRAFHKNPSARTMARQCFYAGILSSLHTSHWSINPKLLCAMVHTGVQTVDEGLVHAMNLPITQARVEALAGLTPLLSKAQLETVRQAAVQFASWEQQYQLLEALLPHMGVAALTDLVLAAGQSGDVRFRQELLVSLAERAWFEKYPDLLFKAAEQLENEDWRVSLWADLAPFLSVEKLSQLLDALPEVRDEADRVFLWNALMPYIPPALLPKICSLQTDLGPAMKEEVLHHLLDTVKNHVQHGIPEGALRDVLGAVQMIEDPTWRERLFLRMVPQLPLRLQKQVITLAERTVNPTARTRLLLLLSGRLPKPLAGHALMLCLGLDDEEWGAEVSPELAPHLAKPLFGGHAGIELGLQGSKWQELEPSSLIPPISESEARRAMQTRSHCPEQKLLWSIMLTCLPDPPLNLLRELACNVGFHPTAIRIWERLLEQNRDVESLKELFQLSRNVEDNALRIKILRLIAIQAPPAFRYDLLHDILDLVCDPELLAICVPLLPDRFLPAAVELSEWMARQVGVMPHESVFYARRRCRYHINLLPAGFASQRPIPHLLTERAMLDLVQLGDVENETTHAIRQWIITHEASKARQYITTLLAPNLNEAAVGGMQLASEEKSEREQAERLALLNAKPAEVLDIARELEPESWRVDLLTRLLPKLPSQYLARAAKLVIYLEDDRLVSKALAPFLRILPVEKALQFFELACRRHPTFCIQMLREMSFEECLNYLSPALEWVSEIRDERERLQALMDMTPFMNSAHYQSVLTILRKTSLCKEFERSHKPGSNPSGIKIFASLLAAEAIRDETERSFRLVSLIPDLPLSLGNGALAGIISTIYARTPGNTADILLKLASLLDDGRQNTILHKVIDLCFQIHGPKRKELLIATAQLIAEQTSSLRTISPQNGSTGLTPHPRLLRYHLLQAAKVKDKAEEERILRGLAPYLPPNYLLDIIQNRPHGKDRVSFLCDRMEYLPYNYLMEILETINREVEVQALLEYLANRIELIEMPADRRDYSDEEQRARAGALTSCVASFGEDLIVSAISAITNPQLMLKAMDLLNNLEQPIPEPLLAMVVGLPAIKKDASIRARAFEVIARHLSEPLLFKCVGLIENPSESLPFVWGLAERNIKRLHDEEDMFSKRFLSRVIDGIRTVQDRHEMEGLLACALRLFGPQQAPQLMRAFRNELSHIGDTGYLISLQWSAAVMGDEKNRFSNIEEALNRIRYLHSEKQKTAILSRLAPYLPESLMETAFSLIMDLTDKNRVRVLYEAAPYLPINSADYLFDMLQQTTSPGARLCIFDAIAPYLSEERLPQALELVETFESEPERMDALWVLAPRLSSDLLAEVLKRTVSPKSRIAALTTPIPKDRLRMALLKAADGLIDRREKLITLITLACHDLTLPISLPDEACLLIEKIEDGCFLTACYQCYSPFLNAEAQCFVAHRAFAALQKHPPNEGPTTWMAWLGASLTHSMKQTYLDMAESLRNEWYKARALTAMAPYFNESMSIRVLDLLPSVESEPIRARLMRAMATRLGAETLPQALEIAQSLKCLHIRTTALAALAKRMDLEDINLLFNPVKAYENCDERREGIFAIYEALPEQHKNTAAKIVVDCMLERYGRSEKLLTLLSRLSHSDALHLIFSLLEQGRQLYRALQLKEAIRAWSRVFLIDFNHKEAQKRIREARLSMSPECAWNGNLVNGGVEAYIRGDYLGALGTWINICRETGPDHEALARILKMLHPHLPQLDDDGFDITFRTGFYRQGELAFHRGDYASAFSQWAEVLGPGLFVNTLLDPPSFSAMEWKWEPEPEKDESPDQTEDFQYYWLLAYDGRDSEDTEQNHLEELNLSGKVPTGPQTGVSDSNGFEIRTFFPFSEKEYDDLDIGDWFSICQEDAPLEGEPEQFIESGRAAFEKGQYQRAASLWGAAASIQGPLKVKAQKLHLMALWCLEGLPGVLTAAMGSRTSAKNKTHHVERYCLLGCEAFWKSEYEEAREIWGYMKGDRSEKRFAARLVDIGLWAEKATAPLNVDATHGNREHERNNALLVERGKLEARHGYYQTAINTWTESANRAWNQEAASLKSLMDDMIATVSLHKENVQGSEKKQDPFQEFLLGGRNALEEGAYQKMEQLWSALFDLPNLPAVLPKATTQAEASLKLWAPDPKRECAIELWQAPKPATAHDPIRHDLLCFLHAAEPVSSLSVEKWEHILEGQAQFDMKNYLSAMKTWHADQSLEDDPSGEAAKRMELAWVRHCREVMDEYKYKPFAETISARGLAMNPLDRWKEKNPQVYFKNATQVAVRIGELLSRMDQRWHLALLPTVWMMPQPWLKYEVLSRFSPYLRLLDPEIKAQLWRKWLDWIPRETRDQVLAEMSLLMPMIKTLGGTESCGEIAETMGRLHRWWP